MAGSAYSTGEHLHPFLLGCIYSFLPRAHLLWSCLVRCALVGDVVVCCSCLILLDQACRQGYEMHGLSIEGVQMYRMSLHCPAFFLDVQNFSILWEPAVLCVTLCQ